MTENNTPTVNELAVRMLTSGFLQDRHDRDVPLHSHTSLGQAEFLIQQLRSIDASTTLEIGLAYGISALCIADEIKGKPNARHYVIDPFQNSTYWSGLGLLNLERAGLRSIVDFREDLAQMVLPQLIQDGVRIDFAYVDAGKRMDDTLLFSHFLQQLVRVGGLIAFDDLSFPGIRKALRYILQQEHFQLKAVFGDQPVTATRKLASSLVRGLPGGSRIFAPELLLPDSELGIATNCVVIEKIAEPAVKWDWHPFF
jgi:predicted O-methyltransferase YrrM